jgi:hypothetical protein
MTDQTADRILLKYPDRAPIIAVFDKNIQVYKNKFLVPYDLTFHMFVTVMRKYISLDSSQAIFCLIGDKKVMAPSSQLVGHIYKEHKSKDKYLYVHVTLENCFGGMRD